MKRKALFIINPVSGGKKKEGVPQLVQKYLDKAVFDAEIVFTDGVAHATQLAKEAVDEHYNLVTAVGGDGTVNEIAQSLVGSHTALGIVPCGSGNGLARFLQVPMNIPAAIKNLNTGRVEIIDTATADGKPFFNMAGIGFDAHISEVFSHQKTRGLITYVRSSFREIVKYGPKNYRVEIDGVAYERLLFMLSFANSSQFGNNAHVSPHASIQDGLLDVCLIKPFPLYRFIEMGIRMVAKTTDKTRYVEIVRGKHIKIIRESPGPLHLDGEPHIAGPVVEINILPRSLSAVVGDSF